MATDMKMALEIAGAWLIAYGWERIESGFWILFRCDIETIEGIKVTLALPSNPEIPDALIYLRNALNMVDTLYGVEARLSLHEALMGVVMEC